MRSEDLGSIRPDREDGSTHLRVCIGHGQGTGRLTDPLKEMVTAPAEGAPGAAMPRRTVLPRLSPLFGLSICAK
jgi:hypothetical protein